MLGARQLVWILTQWDINTNKSKIVGAYSSPELSHKAFNKCQNTCKDDSIIYSSVIVELDREV